MANPITPRQSAVSRSFRTFVKRFLLPVVAIRVFQPLFIAFHRIALVGMNIGPVGEVDTSGERRLMHKLIGMAPADAVIFDVGANVGDFSVLCAECLPIGGNIFSFEPSPTIYRILLETIHSSPYRDRITPIQLGVADTSGKSQLFFNPTAKGTSSIFARRYEGANCGLEKEDIELITLDDFCSSRSIGQIYFIKLDVEGEELACLRGAEKLLSQGAIKYLQFEFGGCDVDSRVFFRDFWEMLSSKFDIYRVLQRGLWRLRNYHELNEIFTTTNFLAVSRGSKIPE